MDARELGQIAPYLWYKECLSRDGIGRSGKGTPTVYQKHRSLLVRKDVYSGRNLPSVGT